MLSAPAGGEGGEADAAGGVAGGEPDGGGGVGGGAVGGGDWDGRGGDGAADLNLAGGAGQPEQGGGPDAGAGGEVGVAAELGGDLCEGAGAPLEEELDGAAGLGPAAEAVGADQASPALGASTLRPPGQQAGVGPAAGCGGEHGEEAVNADLVGQSLAMRDRQRLGAAVAELPHRLAAFGGQDLGAQLAEDVLVGRGAGELERAEAVEDAQPGEQHQPVRGGDSAREAQVGELLAGQHPVVPDEPA